MISFERMWYRGLTQMLVLQGPSSLCTLFGVLGVIHDHAARQEIYQRRVTRLRSSLAAGGWQEDYRVAWKI